MERFVVCNVAEVDEIRKDAGDDAHITGFATFPAGRVLWWVEPMGYIAWLEEYVRALEQLPALGSD